MKIKILGNGGAINDGLNYNAFIIDKNILVETPPDIMISLFNENVLINSIEKIYISHFHGDHTFGFPFLVLRLFWEARKNNIKQSIDLYSPKNGRNYFIDLTERAFSKKHPCIKWIEKNINFITLIDEDEISLLSYSIIPFKMDHIPETYGFILKKGKKIIFSYVADTVWSPGVEKILKKNPPLVLIDLNGEPDDMVPVHLSESEILDKGLKLVNHKTVFYGTHLKYEKKSSNDRIIYVLPGMEIDVDI